MMFWISLLYSIERATVEPCSFSLSGDYSRFLCAGPESAPRGSLAAFSKCWKSLSFLKGAYSHFAKDCNLPKSDASHRALRWLVLHCQTFGQERVWSTKDLPLFVLIEDG